MTIHSEHPFLPPGGERSPLRRLRGRLPAPVSVWTTSQAGRRAGWTVSSFVLADGDPPQLLGLLDEDSDLAELIGGSRTVAVSVLGSQHRALADAFAGQAPAPGGVFRLGSWSDTAWGPVLEDAVGWVGARLDAREAMHAGWALLIQASIEHVELTSEAPALMHLRGRYRPADS